MSELRALSPHLPVVITSGYDEPRIPKFGGNGGVAFMRKPYSRDDIEKAMADAGKPRGG